MKRGKTKRYCYYRCTKTLKRDWHECDTKHVSAPRLDDYIFRNLERISLDRQYIESLMFRLNNSPSGDHRGYELSDEKLNLSGDLFQQTLQCFIEGIKQRKGIDKNLWAKKFIKNILYSKSDIQINLYYSTSSDSVKFSDSASAHKTSRVKTPCAFSPDVSDSSVCDIKGGWGERIRTPINSSRGCSPAVGRLPKTSN